MKTNDYISDNIYSFTIKPYFPLGFKLISILFGVLGANWILDDNLFGILFVLIMIIAFVGKDVVKIDVKNKTYVNSLTLFGQSTGRYKPLPTIDYVSIFPTALSRKMNSMRTMHSSTYIVGDLRTNLIYGKNRRMHVFSAESVEEAQKVSKELSEKLGVGLLDCSGPENVWLIPRNS